MKKKKQKQTLSSSAAAVPDGSDDLKSTIHSHAEFFDRLIELIPARFYLPNNDADSKPWYQGLPKAAKASMKLQSIQNRKLARRLRLDPDSKHQIPKTPLPNEGNFGNLDDDDDDDDDDVSRVNGEEDKEKENGDSVTYESLRQKLRRKIEDLRGNRGEKRPEDGRVRSDGRKRKRDGENEKGEDNENGDGDNEDEDEEEEIIEYGKVRLGDEEEGKGKRKKKKKVSKAKELERAERLREVKMEKPIVAEREAWRAATSKAMGVKVHDDPRLIKESMKKEKRRREKNAEKWKERVATQEKMKGEKQRKRRENIAGRIKEKKMRKIAKREKKLMRPGFEGRKEGFITQD